MNADCRRHVGALLARLPAPPKRVIEFGSLDVNGNVKDLLGNAEYLGVDLQPGPNVDVLWDAAGYDPPWHPDLVLCLNMLEHAPNAPLILKNAWRILAVGGALIVSVPDPSWPRHSSDGGPLHEGEWYRNLTEGDLRAMLGQFVIEELYTEGSLIYVLATKGDTSECRRLNVGSGEYPLIGWANLDQNDAHNAEIVADAMEYLESCEAGRYDEIYAGHFLEHLTYKEAERFMRECYRVLIPGGKLGIVVPDFREVARRYLANSIDAVECPHNVWWPVADLDAVCSLFIYSTIQNSLHQWMYDEKTLRRAFERAGFRGMREIDRYRDPRLGSPAWYQCGADGWKPKEA